jgi:hypothetical protein
MPRITLVLISHMRSMRKDWLFEKFLDTSVGNSPLRACLDNMDRSVRQLVNREISTGILPGVWLPGLSVSVYR